MVTAIVLGAIAFLLLIYASWTAKRLDRLHARVDAAAAALDAQLRARGEAVTKFVAEGHASPTVAAELERAAAAVAGVSGLGHDRESAENELSRVLTATDGELALTGGGYAVADAATRASFARRFHNDAVRDVLVVRRRRVVRYLRLAGRAALPSYFEMVEPAMSGTPASVSSGE
ncbi:MAG TPA: NUDIX hydrolase [Mycobacteriales bacterium]|nr:NUDIX hydrolase [Mycobacteriales bacterium]